MSTPQSGQRPTNPYLAALFVIGGLLPPIAAIVWFIAIGSVNNYDGVQAAQVVATVAGALFGLGVTSLFLGFVGGAVTWQSRRNAVLTLEEIRSAAAVSPVRDGVDDAGPGDQS